MFSFFQAKDLCTVRPQRTWARPSHTLCSILKKKLLYVRTNSVLKMKQTSIGYHFYFTNKDVWCYIYQIKISKLCGTAHHTAFYWTNHWNKNYLYACIPCKPRPWFLDLVFFALSQIQYSQMGLQLTSLPDYWMILVIINVLRIQFVINIHSYPHCTQHFFLS